MITEKRCYHCNNVKSISEFAKHSKNKDGYQSWCKSCNTKFQKEYREKAVEKRKKRQDELFSIKTEHLYYCNCKMCKAEKLQALRDIKKMLRKELKT